MHIGNRVPQGYVRHFQGVSKETTLEEFANKIHAYANEHSPILFGTIQLNPDALYVYGHLRTIRLHDDRSVWQMKVSHAETGKTMNIEPAYADIVLTHDVAFTVEDDTKGRVTYPVYYLTVAETAQPERQTTYFFASKILVSEPLDCVAQFFVHASPYGRDLDLAETYSMSCRREEG